MQAHNTPGVRSHWRASLLAGSLLTLLVSLVVASGASASSPSNVLTVGVVDDNPPFSYLSPTGQLEGFDVAIAKGIAASLGDTAKLVRVDGAGRITGLQTHQLQLTVADLTIDPARSQVVTFTKPYLVSHNILITDKKNSPLKSVAAVNQSGISLGSPQGATSTQQFESEFPKTHVLQYTGIADMLDALSSGQIQGAAWDDIGVISLTQQHPQFVRVPGNLKGPAEDIAAAVPKGGSTTVLKAANTWIANFIKTGQEAKAFRHWFKAQLPAANVPK